MSTALIFTALKMKLDFLKEAYGPGDEVVAKLNIRSLDDLPLKNKLFQFAVRLKGEKPKNCLIKKEKQGPMVKPW